MRSDHCRSPAAQPPLSACARLPAAQRGPASRRSPWRVCRVSLSQHHAVSGWFSGGAGLLLTCDTVVGVGGSQPRPPTFPRLVTPRRAALWIPLTPAAVVEGPALPTKHRTSVTKPRGADPWPSARLGWLAAALLCSVHADDVAWLQHAACPQHPALLACPDWTPGPWLVSTPAPA